MAAHGGVLFDAFAAEYKAIADRARQMVGAFPPLLRTLAEPLLPAWIPGRFSQIVALFPYWVDDLLDRLEPLERPPPANGEDQTATLGLANLLGWWSCLLQDGLLDRELDQPELLPLSMAFHASAVRLLEYLMPSDKAFWDAFHLLSVTAAEADCREQRLHFQRFASFDSKDPSQRLLDLNHTDHMVDRAALLQLTVIAQFSLRGIRIDHPCHGALTEMLRHYTVARQIGDDRSDWAEDLQHGRLNYVSVRIAQRMVDTGVAETYAELDADRMAAHLLYDDELFASIQQEALAACRRAAEALAPYGARYLPELVGELQDQLTRSYKAALDSRDQLQALFAPVIGARSAEGTGPRERVPLTGL